MIWEVLQLANDSIALGYRQIGLPIGRRSGASHFSCSLKIIWLYSISVKGLSTSIDGYLRMVAFSIITGKLYELDRKNQGRLDLVTFLLAGVSICVQSLACHSSRDAPPFLDQRRARVKDQLAFLG